ncbi:AbrB/MazE/SpoVT family DNA-binding domain-containing protein [Candidatus Bathyarchaeota archaeon]|nr:AbrB/MazE/SpoVT family DNA-binding domain-containing protein [Candidatus Bathyarchaeota archaeon]
MKIFRIHGDGLVIVVKRLRVSKGFQVTVPSETREKYGLKPGDEVVWVDTGKEIFVRPLRKAVKLTDIVGKYETEGFDSVLEHDEVVSGEH